MSYQVLARKWRPSTFEEMVGQAHVLRALVNALDQQRLHHAYLFTGTRGVGKTTIARLLAKSLNCEQGVSSKPCGVCSSCAEIAEGRFVDLIEVDAASRTKVEDTRELLENVQYAPTRGRYKVYLIDEVHMLSTSSFNALLKTLEEPPPHVKFLLATTDPQKLPVTVLSRCLQFNLKNMSREHIVQHLSHILSVEQVPFDEPSLWAIAEGAQGSMRDALSLTDQAIAFGQGALKEQEVASMLGTVDLKRVLRLVQALFEKKIDELMTLVAEIDEHSPDYQALMTEMMSTLHRIAIAQAAPNAIDNSKGDKAAIVALAGASYAEDVHLYYQIGTKAKPEMAYAPSERAGFEMALLRMLAFSQLPAANIGALPELVSEAAVIPETVASAPKSVEPPRANEAIADQTIIAAELPPTIASESSAASSAEIVTPKATPEQDELPPWQLPHEPDAPKADFGASGTEITQEAEAVAETAECSAAPLQPQTSNLAEEYPATPTEPVASPPMTEPDDFADDKATEYSSAHSESTTHTESDYIPPAQIPMAEADADESHSLLGAAVWPNVDVNSDPVYWWQVTLHRLGLSGMTKTLFANSQWHGFDGETLSLVISPNYRKIMNDGHLQHLLKALPAWLGGAQRVHYEFGAVEKTPQLWAEQLVQRANHQAFQYLKEDPFIATLMNEFNGQLQVESAIPNTHPIPSGV
ncbi:DNA polymerase III subunit gamma/tau [Reinekea sp. G2M2-21]|uniref:DNA polymerase III subunit gamma/tau n=1 Tax=Reinekea sp. G2M2-21 TaxID=2788942 RepID=UPI0018AC3FFB|nr:DNA polymerase III subunit gamma/tau [Reinekea sp. G2M2-21]